MNKKVLVVEDDVDAGDALVDVLADAGFVVRVAHDGAAACAAAVEFGPDVVLLDIGLPDMSGYSVACLLRERVVGLWIIAITGHCEHKDLLRSRGAGVDVHLAKPVRVHQLLALLEGLRARRADEDSGGHTPAPA